MEANYISLLLIHPTNILLTTGLIYFWEYFKLFDAFRCYDVTYNLFLCKNQFLKIKNVPLIMFSNKTKLLLVATFNITTKRKTMLV